MASKYVDSTAIMQVIGNVYNNPQLLEYTDKYTITEEDFPDEFHRIAFGSIYKLYELGAESICLESIADFLSARPKKEAIFKQQKGEEWLIKVSENALPEAFDYYYNRMKKFTLLRAYNQYGGMDVSDIYDPDNILDVKKKQQQEELLDNCSLVQLAFKIEGKIEEIRQKFVDNNFEEAKQAGDGINDLIADLEKHPEVGSPLYGQMINTVTRGARLKKFYLRSAPSGTGKAIPNYTLIPTPQGWRKVGDIKPGDELFGQDGKPTKVLQIHPQPEEKEIWKVIFSDGRVAECCKDHLWEYRYDAHRGKAYRTETIEEIYNRVLSLKGGLKNSDKKGYRFHIRLNEPLQYSTKQFSIDPYVMGAILGDGSLRYNDTNKALSFSSNDEELPNSIAKILGDYICKKSSDFNYDYTFKPITNLEHNLWVEELFKDYPKLWNLKSKDKFIPNEYLQGDVEQRYALLQGLLDTDGSIETKGRVSFTTISPQLRDNVVELCRSLGMVTSCLTDQRAEKYTTGECYTVHIQCKKELKPKLFRLKRKVAIATDYANSNKRCEYKDHLAIIDIQKTTEKTNMTCFTVDNNNHLFLMNNFLVTHNTRSMIADACYIACNEIYDDRFGWIHNGVAQPTLFVTTEQEISEIQTMMLAFLSMVNEEHILNGQYQEGEKERVLKAAEILKNSPLYIEELPDFSLQDVEDTIKRNIREHNVSYVFWDYIHSSLKILEEISKRAAGTKLREDSILFMMSIRMKDICNEYGIFLMSATQLSGDYANAETPDQNLLRGAKSLADKIDYGGILLPVRDDDLVKLEKVLGTGIFQKPQIKLSVYKNRRGRYKGIYLWAAANLGTCRIDPIFATDWSYELLEIDDIKIQFEDEPSAF